MHTTYFEARINNNPHKLKYSVSAHERRSLIKEVGNAGLLVYEYFLRMASLKDPIDLDDDTLIAQYFGWKTSTAYRWRRALYNNGWLAKVKTSSKRGHSTTQYFLGKEKVLELNS